MEIFFSYRTEGDTCLLDHQESTHCCRVLRHRCGDSISVIDGSGTLYDCIIEDNDPRQTQARIVTRTENWGGHPYDLCMAVCPTKNIDRYEWFCEKAVETGVDSIVPVIGEHSERRSVNAGRMGRILVSAAKQSLKGVVPCFGQPCTVEEFVRRKADGRLRLIACCFEDAEHPRRSIAEALNAGAATDIDILIGPEGDFSPAELAAAIDNGFVPVHLGPSRLRTESAALLAVQAVYSKFLL